MANNLKHTSEDPPSSPSLSAGEKETEFVSSQEDEEDQHTIFSSDEDETEDPPPRSSGEAQLSGRKRLSEGISTKVSLKRAKKGEKMGTKKRLFSEKDEIVLLQGIIDSKGKKNPLEDKRSFYESVKGSISFDVTLDQFKDKIRHMQKKYTAKEKSAASILNPHEQKCFQLSKAIWGAAGGVAVESANGKSKKRGLVTPRRGSNSVQEDGSKRGDMKKKSQPLVVEKESDDDWDESSFFLGMDFLKANWTKVLSTESKKETQEKMKKLHDNELECQKFEEMLKAMKDKCAHDKVQLLNEVTSLIMATD